MTPTPPTWDLFCRVIDNYGDAGVCWRLAKELARRGQRVRLVIDDATPLTWMAAGPAERTAGVDVMPWPGPERPGDVVVEAFGCDPPPAFVDAMAACAKAPTWINLEYLSAEAYVERSHGLPSPQRNGLIKRFFFPGFTPRTGGLLREKALLAERHSFDRQAWLASNGLDLRPGERVVTLFCYANSALPQLLADLSLNPTLLLLTPGPAQEQVTATNGHLRLARLPYLSQTDFDHLLWASDLNFVRGEDSLVRAIWAGAPFVWQAYPQDDGAHWAKVEAVLEQLQASEAVSQLWRAWNGKPGVAWPGLPGADDWAPAMGAWRQRLLNHADLATQLISFARTVGPTTAG